MTFQPELVGRDKDLALLRAYLEDAIQSNGSTVLVSGEAGIGKTRLVSELIGCESAGGMRVIHGWCLSDKLEPFMPFRTALREAGLFHLISGDPPPLAISAYLIDGSGRLVAKAERGEHSLDADVFSGMLTAVGDFVQASLSMMGRGDRGGLNTLGYERYRIIIETQGNLSLAVVMEGRESEFLVEDMRRTLMDIGDGLDGWDGDMSEVDAIVPKIEWFVVSGKYDGRFLVDDPKLKQENLFDNVLLGVQRASEDAPILLFLDDLQWADPSTLGLLHYLARNTRKNRVLIVGTYRPEDIMRSEDGKAHQLETAMQNMSREGLIERVELKRLGAGDSLEFIGSALGRTSFDNPFYERVYRETEGSPLFLLEVLKMLGEEGVIVPNADGVWERTAGLERMNIPSKVYDVVKRRLDRLVKEQREILDCASVIGEEFSSDIIGRSLQMSRMGLLKNLSEIERTHHLIHSLEKRYRFDHSKIREVIYCDLMDELKEEYHRVIGDTLAELYRYDIEVITADLAHHYHEAGDARAGEWLLKAGDGARDRFANEEAIRFYRNSLEHLGEERRPLVLEKLGDVQVDVGEYDGAIGSYLQVSEMATDAEVKARMLRKTGIAYEKKGDFASLLGMMEKAKGIVGVARTVEHGRLCIGMGIAHIRRGEYDQAMPYMTEALEIFRSSGGDQRDIGDALRAIGNVHLSKGDSDRALQCYRESLTVMEGISDLRGIAAALHNISVTHHVKGELDKALGSHLRSLEFLEKIGDKWGIADAFNNIGEVYQYKGELDRALPYLEQSLGIAEKFGQRYSIAAALNCIGNVQLDKGEFDKAMELLERALANREEIGDKRGVAEALCNIGVVHMYRGDLGRATEALEHSLKLREGIGDKWGTAETLCIIGEARLNGGEVEKALEFYERSLALSEEVGDKKRGARNLIGLGKVHIGLGDIEAAHERASKGMELAVETGARKEEAEGHGVLGMVHRARSEWTEAMAELDLAVQALGEVGDRKGLAIVLYEYGLLWQDRGEPAKAMEHFERALSEFERMGMKRWAERCSSALCAIQS